MRSPSAGGPADALRRRLLPRIRAGSGGWGIVSLGPRARAFRRTFWVPDVLRPFLHVQPLAGLVDIPFRIYFADLKGTAAMQGLALQAGWTLVLIGLGRLAMERMMRRLELQGG